MDRRLISLCRWMVGALLALVVARAEPVTFVFSVDESGDPFAREIWAEVVTPSGRTLRLPAYYAEDGRFVVRARADEAGDYALGVVQETLSKAIRLLSAKALGPTKVNVRMPERLPQVQVSKADSREFALSDGRYYVPFGTNLAWPPAGAGARWYRKAFGEFAATKLNWTRIWMAHWSGLNLDWLPPERGSVVRAGAIDARVAEAWDFILNEAERQGVYVQLVLQHHGPWSTTVNSNWPENPWNAANPDGFLATPGEFFTSPRAIEITKRKYRYIVARWGYSPAVMAWELFNEVHWTDGMRLDKNVAAVARWHAEMAEHIRNLDAYGHLVTTSTDDLRSPVYAAMDYFQPHLYAHNMLAAVQRFDEDAKELGRPIFYGEVGDDHMRLSREQKSAGIELGPIAWAGAMGEGRVPAQLWEGAELLERGRLKELRALALVVEEIARYPGDETRPFSAAIESGARVPLVIESGEYWHRRAPQTIAIPADGRQVLELGMLPGILVGSPESLADGYADRVTLEVDFPHDTTVRVRLGEAGPKGARADVLLDGEVAGQYEWPSRSANAEAGTPSTPVEIAFPVKRDLRRIQIQNSGGADWFAVEGIDLGIETSALTSIGLRSEEMMALWIWHRAGVFALKPVEPGEGVLLIEDVSEGEWTATWWDSVSGEKSHSIVFAHPGGRLRLPTPKVARHAAVMLRRS